MTDQASLKKKYNYDQATPMMQQYFDVKFQHQNCLLLFRMGDFYELFLDDAIVAAKVLGIALAKRGKTEDTDIPMCGVPHHALETYLPKLTAEGYNVAICDQLETPEEAKKNRGYKAVVKRDVTRIITAGTIIEESMLEQNEPNYLLALCLHQDQVGLCYADISTNQIFASITTKNNLAAELAKLNPREIILSEKLQLDGEVMLQLQSFRGKLVYQVDSYFAIKKAISHIENFYKIQSIDSLGNLPPHQIIAVGAVVEYINLTQKAHAPEMPLPKIIIPDQSMQIDPSARRNLEITQTLSGQYKGSLFANLNKTVTKAGSRLLYNYLSAPLADANKINQRLLITEFFFTNKNLSNNLRDLLKHTADIERSLARIAANRAYPRDLAALRSSMELALRIKEILLEHLQNLPDILQQSLPLLSGDDELLELLQASVNDEVPNNLADGGVIKCSYHPKLQELNELILNSAKIIDVTKDKYRKETGIDSLKINNNNVLGLFIDVTPKNSEKMSDPKFLHRQTLANSVRYTTEELKVLEVKIVNARSLALNLEKDIFDNICAAIKQKYAKLQKLAEIFARIDLFCSFAFIANENNYTKPIIDDSLDFIIKGGRHPIVELALKNDHSEFVANDCNLSPDQRLWLITGPNMSGKSTFLRQNALLALMAQTGSFIPATYAKIGVIDKLYSRIGASDDLAKGQSTFMVEMIESANILSQSTYRSLIILDEVGRGTSTYDGVSIAWAMLEYIHDKLKSRSLFATHYHELTILSETLNALKNYTVQIVENNEKILFLYKIISGSADKSYGIHVAELAGLPKTITKKAKQILQRLESESGNKQTDLSAQQQYHQSLCAYTAPQNDDLLELKQLIAQINPDELSPKEALEKLYELQKQIHQDCIG